MSAGSPASPDGPRTAEAAIDSATSRSGRDRRPVTIVTGAAGGIGAGIVRVLAGRGHEVVGFDIAPGPGIRVVDITDSASVQRAVEQVVGSYGRIDGLVNNAAIGPLGTVLDTDDEVLDRILAVNVKGAFFTARAVLGPMVAARSGSIVNIGSGAGHGKANMAAYAASKAAVHGLSASMAYDYFADRIRVNTVIPGGGGIPSGISLGRFGGTAEEYAALPHSGSVAGRPVDPLDVGRAVAYLLSDDAVAVSGTIVDVGCMAGQGGPLKVAIPSEAGPTPPAASGGRP